MPVGAEPMVATCAFKGWRSNRHSLPLRLPRRYPRACIKPVWYWTDNFLGWLGLSHGANGKLQQWAPPHGRNAVARHASPQRSPAQASVRRIELAEHLVNDQTRQSRLKHAWAVTIYARMEGPISGVFACALHLSVERRRRSFMANRLLTP